MRIYMSYLCSVICFVFVEPRIFTITVQSDDEAPTPEMARQHGYKCETHEVVTEDGYILHVHRLPGGRQRPVNTTFPPVLLQHGLLGSSADWLITGPDKSLGYLLADQGYDVWLGNARGNTYSRAHRTLKIDDPRFWNWTWHEMGRHDLPAVVDRMLHITGHEQILYVGHSMGTTMFFVLLTTRPEYNTKVRYMAALAPVAFMGHTTSPIRYLAPYAHSFEIIADFFGDGEFLPRSSFMDRIFKWSCEMSKFEERICENYLFIICGHDPQQFNQTLLPLILGHIPAGTSTKTLVHYAQEIRSSKFQQYDYGADKNMILYNSTTPPQYNLSLVSVPVSLHYGDNDLLASPMDVSILFSHLKSAVGSFRVNLTSFNHLDFLWGRDAKTLLYDQLESLLNHFADPKAHCLDVQDSPQCPAPVIADTFNMEKKHERPLTQNIPFGKNPFYVQLQSISQQLQFAIV